MELNLSGAAKGMSSVYSNEEQRFCEELDKDWLTKLSRYQFLYEQKSQQVRIKSVNFTISLMQRP